MSFLRRLLGKFGYVRLSDHGLVLTDDGRVVSAYPTPAPRQLPAARQPVIAAGSSQRLPKKRATADIAAAPKRKTGPTKPPPRSTKDIPAVSAKRTMLMTAISESHRAPTQPKAGFPNVPVAAGRVVLPDAPRRSQGSEGGETFVDVTGDIQSSAPRNGGAIGRAAKGATMLGHVSKEKNSKESTQMLDLGDMVEVRDGNPSDAIAIDATRVDLLLPDF